MIKPIHPSRLAALCLMLCVLCSTSLPTLANDSQVYTDQQQQTTDKPATIVLIIDDMGNGLQSGRRAIALPGPINYAFLPNRPSSKVLAELAHQQGKEIMLHIPMSNVLGHNTGPGTLQPIMNRRQFLATLHNNLESIPHVRGVNNHMGSLLTQLREPMHWLMAELKQRNLYFIDSRTSPLSVAEALANSHQLATRRRDVFLDNERDPAAIATQFERLITRAKQQGIAVAIGHPHPETLEFLERAIPTLADRGVTLSLASAALNSRSTAQDTCAAGSVNKPRSANDCTQALTLAKAKNDKDMTK